MFVKYLDCENGFLKVLDKINEVLANDQDWLRAAALETAVFQLLEYLIVSMTIH